jgi:hypothetical protein
LGADARGILDSRIANDLTLPRASGYKQPMRRSERC